jgi:hypothetical protein
MGVFPFRNHRGEGEKTSDSGRQPFTVHGNIKDGTLINKAQEKGEKCTVPPSQVPGIE